MKRILQFMIGYLTGFVVFFILLPWGLFELSKCDAWNGYTILINSSILKTALSFLLTFTGLTFVIWSNLLLLKVGKGGPAEGMGVAISPRTKKLVTSGPYRFSRNPMVFGAFATYLAIVLYLNSLTGLLGLLLMLILAIRYLKKSEENRLEKDFAHEYRVYRNRVPMIFPFIRLKKQPKRLQNHLS